MKKFILSIALALSVLTAKAQTVTNIVVTNTPVTNTVITTVIQGVAGTNNTTASLGQVASDLGAWLSDNQPYFATNGNIRLDAFALKNGSSWGGVVDSHIPLTSTGQISTGVALGYLRHNFYDAALNLNLGKTINPLSLFGSTNTAFQIYTWGESGPYLNLNNHAVGAQNFGGGTWNTHLGPGQLSITVMGGYISQLGTTYGGGISYGFKF
jgi:hypothetical protein